MIETYKTMIETSFENAQKNQSKLIMENYDYNYCPRKISHFYNNILSFPDTRLLRIGISYSCISSFMYGNKAKIICILPDNSELGFDKMRFLKMFEKFKGDNEVIFMDWFEVDTTTHFNIYMCDGNHNSYNRLKCLLQYYSCLDEIFIFIINQWNFNAVKMETKDLIKNVNLKVLYEKEIIINHNFKPPSSELQDTWWNGIYVAILQKQ